MITSSIVLYKTNEHLLIDLLICIEKSPIERVFVIDNSVEPIYKDVVDNYCSKTVYIQGHGNIGYGAGHNLAMVRAQNAKSIYHIILNPDISFKEGTIESLFDFMESHPDVGYVLPNVVYPNGEKQFLCKLLPSPLDILGRRVLPKSWMKNRNEKFEMRVTGYNKTRNVPMLSGCFMFLRLEVIKKVGLFDDRFFMYFEDFDLIRRIHQVSKTVFYPSTQIIHNHAQGHRYNKTLLIMSIKSAIKYFNKWGWFFDRERMRVNKNAFEDSNIIVD